MSHCIYLKYLNEHHNLHDETDGVRRLCQVPNIAFGAFHLRDMERRVTVRKACVKYLSEIQGTAVKSPTTRTMNELIFIERERGTRYNCIEVEDKRDGAN